MQSNLFGRRRGGKTRLLSATALSAAVLAGGAQAQEPAPSGDVVTVTGSRIVRPDYEFSNPIVSVEEETLSYSGVTNLTDFVSDYPALANSFDFQESAQTQYSSVVGLNLLDLRNLGTERTLVLVDGLRHVSGNEGTAAVDINTIPIGLIERIEVLTGGASAIYGADGVTGVVNFVMKDDFEGVDARFQHGQSGNGGGERTFGSALVGHNFNGGRTNVTLAYEFSREGSIDQADRDYAAIGQREVLTGNPNDLGDDPDIFDNVFLRDVRYPDTSPGGSITTDFDFGDDGLGFGIDYNGDGTPWTGGLATPDFTVIGGDGSLLDLFVDELLPESSRDMLHATFRHEATPAFNFYGSAKYVIAETDFRAQPTFDFGEAYRFLGIYVPIDNPFIPENARADALLPGNAGDAEGGVFVLRDNLDLGYTGRDIKRKTFRGVLGQEGQLTDSISYNVSYVYGETRSDVRRVNDRIHERWFAAIDAVEDASGNIVCRSDLDPTAVPLDFEVLSGDPGAFGTTFTPGANSGCVPADIFGEDVSPEAAAWINQTTLTQYKIDQHVLTAYLTGDTTGLFELPAGTVGWAVGGEHREESSRFIASPLGRAGYAAGYDVLWSGQDTDTYGAYDVSDLFAEVEVPVLADLAFAKELTLDAAYRFSHYSTAGDTETWKVGGRWRLTDHVMIRATEAKAVRAPNISELFLPRSQTFDLLVDPCDKDNVDAGTGFRFDNCEAALAALGYDVTTFDDTQSDAVEGIIGGNPNLDAEEARTSTIGIVVEPSFVPGLTLSLDYYDINLSDAIQAFEAQTIVDKCYDLPTPNNFCDLVGRDPNTGFLDYFEQTTVNVANYTTRGYDFTVRYQLDPADLGIERDIGTFNFSLVGNHIDDLTFVELADAEPDEEAGEPGAPEWTAVFDLTWQKDRWTVNYGLNYFSRTDRVTQMRQQADPDWVPPGYFEYSERLTHDLQVRAAVNDQFDVYLGVNNLFDQEPDRGSLSEPIGPLGRFVYAGVTFNTDQLGLLN